MQIVGTWLISNREHKVLEGGPQLGNNELALRNPHTQRCASLKISNRDNLRKTNICPSIS